MSKYLWLIDEGHGGIDPSGNYTTPAKKGKQYKFTNHDVSIFEGNVNRQIGRHLKDLLKAQEIEFESMNNPIFDTPLSERVSKAKSFFDQRKCIFVSIHNDKIRPEAEIEGVGQSKVNKQTVYTSIGQTVSDVVADVFSEHHRVIFPDFPQYRDFADGDSDVEADFYLLRYLDEPAFQRPAILLECRYFDNIEGARFLLSKEGPEQLAIWILGSILKCEKNLDI